MDTDIPVAVSLDGPLMPGRPARASAAPRIVSLAAGCFQSFARVDLAAGLRATGIGGGPRSQAAALAVPALTIAGGTAMVSYCSQEGSVSNKKLARVSAGSAAAAGAVAAGTASRSVRAWGRNASGRLGNGSTADSDTPVKVKLPKGIKVRQMRAGCTHTLALTTKGHAS